MSTRAETLAILLHVGDEAYAVACADVVSVVPRPHLRSIPSAPAEVLGVFVFRGQVVPVVDLALRLGGGETPDLLSSRVVLVCPAGRTLGVLAAHVGDVVRLPRAAARVPMSGEPAVAEIVLHEGRAILWLELAGLVPERVEALLEGAP